MLPPVPRRVHGQQIVVPQTPVHKIGLIGMFKVERAQDRTHFEVLQAGQLRLPGPPVGDPPDPRRRARAGGERAQPGEHLRGPLGARERPGLRGG